ncbi:MAG: transcriptional regulator [Candidatus Poribacteria bacterium]|nr:transcriptional regulator [Candidatus Poribacteria bacterium]
MRKMRTFSEYLMEILADREEAIGFIEALLEEYHTFGSTAALLHGLRTAVEAQGGASKLAEQTDISPEILSKALDNNETLQIDTLTIILKAFGCRLSIEPLEAVISAESAEYSDVAD